jgi:hypothetical protein
MIATIVNMFSDRAARRISMIAGPWEARIDASSSPSS